MKKIHTNTVYLLAFILILNVSCTKWLDVKPKSEVEASEIFTTEKGYIDVLMGIYSKMSDGSTYGDVLTMSTLEILAQNHKSTSNKQLEFANFVYNTAYADDIFTNIWESQFNTIANCNSLIDHIKVDKPEKFLNNNYKIIYGEALAIRALLHFDLIRMFHPSYTSNKDYKAIPYIKKFTKELTRQYTTEEALTNVLDDLKKSYNLLKDVDPIKSHLDFRERQLRLNYYAVSGLLSRVYIYKDDKQNALKYAKEVIASEIFKFIAPDKIIVPKKDYTFSCEHLFSLFVTNLGKTSRTYFEDKATKELVCAQRMKLNNLYEGNDLRLKNWFEVITSEGGTKKRFMTKYYRPRDKEIEKTYYKPIIPIIKIAEMYLIAAECLTQTNLTEAISLMNIIRQKRESSILKGITDAGTLMNEINKEYQREFFGEGQLFYFYKRLNMTVIKDATAHNLMMDATKYTFPLPKKEVQFGSRITY
jgi:hypothetical protein